jgi:hypothetical protein
MDDYHEFKYTHEVEIMEWRLYWAPNYVSITIMIMIPSGMLTTLNIILTIESDTTMAMEPLEVGMLMVVEPSKILKLLKTKVLMVVEP